jgi:hypothetical protein
LRRQSADPPAALAPKEAPLSRAEGIAKRLDCDGKAARFTVQVNNAAMVFQILDPSRVALKHSGEATHDFTCGPQKPYHVVVEYEAQVDTKTGIAGVVRSIEF